MARLRRRTPRKSTSRRHGASGKREWSLAEALGLTLASGVFLAVFGWALTRGDIAASLNEARPAVEDPAARATPRGEDATPDENPVSFLARVVGVTDGDTIKVLDEGNKQHTIRLAEIDAPERGQPWGDRSRQALAALVFSKTVSVQQTDTDRYGRVVARVFADGEDINRTMVEVGAAWAYRQYLTDETLIATEARARRERVGLWSMGETQTVAPWEWRQGERVGNGARSDPENVTPVQSLLATPVSSVRSDRHAVDQFSCSGNRYCPQMSSCAEANFYLRQCGVSSLDGDSDGEACEVLCGTAG